MTAIVILRYRSDAAAYERVLRFHRADFDVLTEIARAEGCLHHRVAVSDDDRQLVVVDEWPDTDAYNRFSSNPAVIEILRGWALDDPPTTDYYRSLHDQTDF
jgi:quinol monooxygenase YgiN